MLTLAPNTELQAALSPACPRPRVLAPVGSLRKITASGFPVAAVSAVPANVLTVSRAAASVRPSSASAPVLSAAASRWSGFAGVVRPSASELAFGYDETPVSAVVEVPAMDERAVDATGGFGADLGNGSGFGIEGRVARHTSTNCSKPQNRKQDKQQHLTARRVTRTWRPPH